MAHEADALSDLRLVEELGMLIGRCRKALGAHAERALELHGEAGLRWGVLVVLVRGGAATQRDLAEQIAQDPAAISRVVDDLEGEKLVRRNRDPDDRRKMRVEATAAGRRHFERIQRDVVVAVDRALTGLTRGDRLQLRALLLKLLEGQLATNCPAKPSAPRPRRGE